MPHASEWKWVQRYLKRHNAVDHVRGSSVYNALVHAGWDTSSPPMVGPDPWARISKRSWETAIQVWRRELAVAAQQSLPVGLRRSGTDDV